jgi:hypothetical protein
MFSALHQLFGGARFDRIPSIYLRHRPTYRDVPYLILNFPAFPVKLGELDKTYVKELLLAGIQPVAEEFKFNFKKTELTFKPYTDTFTGEKLVLLDSHFQSGSCKVYLRFRQGANKDLQVTIIQFGLETCAAQRRFARRFEDDLAKAVSRIINRMLLDARMSYIAPIRWKTNKFLGPAEDAIKRFLS